jgi:ABC-type lipoprotein release transport system permease subunit
MLHKLPLTYNLRNLTVRRTSNLMAALGIALVVMVLVWVLALAQGFQRALAHTGSPNRALLMRGGATSEVQSYIARETADILRVMPEVAIDDAGRPLASAELVVIVSLPKRSDGSISNVVVRGVSKSALQLRPELHVVQGRTFQPGMSEVLVGRQLAKRVRGCGVGESLTFGGRTWQVVGVFDAGGSGFESEVWGDGEILIPAFDRDGYSSMTLALRDPKELAALKARAEADPRLHVQVQSELAYYEAQSESLAGFLRGAGVVIAGLMAFGAMAGALNTMFAAVNTRTREIGTLMALGFPRWSVLGGFLLESMLLAAAGGVVGCALGSLVHGVSTGTTNWASFSELDFEFRVTPAILGAALLFAVVMGAIGGLLPAARAARMQVSEALRAV